MLFKKKRKTCDLCGQKYELGCKLIGIGKNDICMCDKCEYVLKNVILGYRKIRPNELTTV